MSKSKFVIKKLYVVRFIVLFVVCFLLIRNHRVDNAINRNADSIDKLYKIQLEQIRLLKSTIERVNEHICYCDEQIKHITGGR